ncbi:hypothetical protein GCM10012279_38540 [Micromonospora yangpuensis]|nr:hypothetical protein GCM10012279_38540 [Micromonospora yangpuensis]
MSAEFLWYIPNQVEPGHRGDDIVDDHNSLDTLTRQAQAVEEHGWGGALIGTGWGRPDTFTGGGTARVPVARRHPLRALRHALPTGGHAPGRPTAAPAAR